MTTENIVQDTEESRIAQQKRETLHSLLYIMAECAPSAEKFMGIDVKALARKVNEAYDQLGNNYTVEADPAANPLAGLVVPGNNVLAMHAGSTVEKTVCDDAVNVGSRPSYVTSISFGEICDVDGQLRMEAQITWSDGSKTEKSAGDTDILAWQPSMPEGEGWFIASIHDTEDGPVCLWIRHPTEEQLREAEDRKKLQALKEDFLAKHRACEKAAYEYFAACPEGDERVFASEVYQRVRLATSRSGKGA